MKHYDIPCPRWILLRGFNVWAAAEIKKVVNIPVIAVGRINDPALAEEIIAQGKADFVAIGRALLTDPQWPTKAKEGRSGESRRCIACSVDRLLLESKHVTCMLNPTCGREQESSPLSPANKKVVRPCGNGAAAPRL